jgi:hypothetical protein
VSRLAGHASLQMTLRYIATAEDPLGDQLAAGAPDDDQDDGIPRMGRWG